MQSVFVDAATLYKVKYHMKFQWRAVAGCCQCCGIKKVNSRRDGLQNCRIYISSPHKSRHHQAPLGNSHSRPAGEWGWPLPSNWCRSGECMELYLQSTNAPSWRGARLKQGDNFTFTFLRTGVAQWYSAELQPGWPVRVPAEAGNYSLHHRV
jgi:hypothetical protein